MEDEDLPEEFDVAPARHIAYDDNGHVALIVYARMEDLTAAQIMRAIEFLQSHWQVDEREA